MVPPFHYTGFQCSPSSTKKKKKKNFLKKNVPHSGANDWELNAKPVTFQQDRTNGLSPHPEAEVWCCNMD